MRFSELANKRVAVWGYGREGRAAIQALHQYLPGQTVTVLATAAEAERACREHAPLECHVGEPDFTTLTQFDAIIKSPGISAYKPALLEAKNAGVKITSGTALWFAENPDARVIAVTGTKGKSTTAALTAYLLRQLGHRVALAGNIGLPLLELLNPPLQPDWWVIELSSFQTCEENVAPDIAVVLNLYEEHLDWHGSVSQYHHDKLAILKNTQRTLAVLNADIRLRALDDLQRKVWFNNPEGWHVENAAIFRGAEQILERSVIPLPGTHNALNVCAALTAVEATGGNIQVAASHISTFHPLPHRLQTLGERHGLTWINDSISTAPQATLEALRSVQGQLVTVLVGGFDRGVDWQNFANAMEDNPPHAIIALGANGPRIVTLLSQGKGYYLECCTTLAEAVGVAKQLTPAGGVILLSPGAPSFDQFRDYAERGRLFASLGGFDAALIAQIEGLGIA